MSLPNPKTRRHLIVALFLSALLLVLTEASSASLEWVKKTSTPAQGGYGQAVVGTGEFVYVIRCLYASSQVQFWKYNPSANSWGSLSTGLEAGTFRNGTALAWDGGNLIYALAGARYEDTDRRLFLRYYISTNAWESLSNTPGPQGAGDALAWSGYDQKLYAFLGSSKHGTVFACYDPQTGSWTTKTSPPGGIDDGASLAWAGGRYIYALRGEYLEDSPLTDFWTYDIEAGSWQVMSSIPDSGGVGDGGSLLWIGGFMSGEADYIYALGGGSYDESGGYGFFRYRISTDTWERLQDLPAPIGYYNGNRLGFAGGYIHYWQGAPSTWAGGGNAFYVWTMPPTNNPPVLSSGSVSPTSGAASTTFTYEVTYTDLDGDAPSYVKVYIDGVGYSMTKINGTYTGGALYRYTTTLSVDSHTYFFTASDGTDTARLPTSGSYSGPTVTAANTAPTLSSGSVSPSSGATGATFTYEVTYMDADGDAPSYVRVYIDGSAKSMSYMSGAYTGGALYCYQTALGIGSHTFYFEASDNRGATARLPASGSYSGPSVGLTPTTLSISPSSFSVSSEGTQTLTATLTAGGSPLANKAITWTTTIGSLSPASGITNFSGQVSVTYTAPSVNTSAAVTVSASFAGDNHYGSSSGSSSGTVSPTVAPSTFQVVLTFRKPDGSPLANAEIYYSTSEGQETSMLGTTDSDGKITSTDPVLAGKTMYFETSDGKYAGSVYITASGGEVSLTLTETTKPVESPIAAVAGLVILICFIAIMWKFLTFLKKRKG